MWDLIPERRDHTLGRRQMLNDGATQAPWGAFKKIDLFIYLFIYLTEREGEREREHKQGKQQAEGEREAGSLLSREPDMGLDPRTLGS